MIYSIRMCSRIIKGSKGRSIMKIDPGASMLKGLAATKEEEM